VRNLILQNLAGPLIFVGGLILMFLVVPWERVKELFWVGVVCGLVVAVILVFLMQNIFGFWSFHQADLVYLFKVPLFISAGWLPVVIAFSHLLIRSDSFIPATVTILAFPAVATLVHALLIANHMLTYHHWSLFFTFLVALIIHIGIAGYLYASEQLRGLT
jgi:hypothetical protein